MRTGVYFINVHNFDMYKNAIIFDVALYKHLFFLLQQAQIINKQANLSLVLTFIVLMSTFSAVS